MTDPKVSLSASRIKTAQSCSWLYHCKYILGLPDMGNDGSSRGTICHLIFELLGNSKRAKHLAKILKSKDLFSVKSVERLVRKHSNRLGVGDETNIQSIKDMTLNGLSYDFLGKKNGKPTEALSEKDFEIVVNENGFRYKIKGFIDKLFLYKKQKLAIIRDFKSSKQAFKGKEITDNLQDYMYSLAVKHLYPEYENRQSEFLFLKFELKEVPSEEDSCEENLVKRKAKTSPTGLIRMAPIGSEDLEGFEHQLTAIQDYLDGFGSEDALSNLAAKQRYPSDDSFSGPLQCGRAKYKGELKKDGTVMWHCPFKFPFDYFIIESEGKQAASFYTKEEANKNLVKFPKGKIIKKHYKGCPAFHKIDS